MCGIGGKISFSAKPDPGLGKEMNDRMNHRGPDAAGVYAEGPALLAHRRLSIIDLSEAGEQPMSNSNGTVHVVFNGEIYNYQELRDRLTGYSYQSDTDTEVLLHLYEEYGVDCLQHLRGMFAFAIWDENTERLFLARDRLGQKPLYYKRRDETFWFASTLSALFADDELEAEPDHAAIRQYLTYQYTPPPATGFRGVRQLRPGEFMLVDENGVESDHYWSLSYSNQFDATADKLASRLRERLREAMRLRLRSDVPLGVFLSGGVDSSVVTALASELSDEPVKTYSIGFNEPDYDELEFAREVADSFGTDHHEYTVTPDMVEVLPQLVAEYEMPFGDVSALPTYYVSKVASEDITVALTGDAGDETFAGYDRYVWDRTASRLARIPEPVRDLGIEMLDELSGRLGERDLVRYGSRGLRIADADDVRQYAAFVCHALGQQVDQVWAGNQPKDELAFLRRAFDRADGQSRLDHLMHVDIQTYLPNDLLVKVDRASMAHSLEVRSPFLDHELVEFAAKVPAAFKLRDGTKKWLLKEAFRSDLPDIVIEREKQGFGVPVDEWFRGALREFARESLDCLGSREPYDDRGLAGLFAEHQRGADHGYRLWDLVFLEEWYQQFID